MPAAVLPLVVAMVEPSFRALLVPAIGLASLKQSGLIAAGIAAISLAAIAAGAEKEKGATFETLTKPLPQNHFAMRRHAYSQAGLDTGDHSVAR